MTAPVDHRPYAGPGDLVTAEDVARWLRSIPHTGRPWPNECPVCSAMLLLTERLDRERRQACRRGALDAWRRFCDEAGGIDWTGESLDVWGNRRRALGALARTLAFRAAARQP